VGNLLRELKRVRDTAKRSLDSVYLLQRYLKISVPLMYVTNYSSKILFLNPEFIIPLDSYYFFNARNA
jgi:hypothetical protein